MTQVVVCERARGLERAHGLWSFLTAARDGTPVRQRPEAQPDPRWDCLHWAPAAIRVNGEPLEPRPAHRILGLCGLRGAEPLPEPKLPALRVAEREHAGPYSAHLMVTGGDDAELIVVVHGVTRGRFRVHFGYPGILVVAYASYLTLDASRSSLVLDETLEELGECLRSHVHWAVLAVAARG